MSQRENPSINQPKLILIEPEHRVSQQFSNLRQQLDRNNIPFESLFGFQEAKEKIASYDLPTMMVINNSNYDERTIPNEIFSHKNIKVYCYPKESKNKDFPPLRNAPKVIDTFKKFGGQDPQVFSVSKNVLPADRIDTKSPSGKIRLKSIKKDIKKTKDGLMRQPYEKIMIILPKNLENREYSSLFDALKGDKKNVEVLKAQNEVKRFNGDKCLLILEKEIFDDASKFIISERLDSKIDIAVLGFKKGLLKENHVIATQKASDITDYLLQSGIEIPGLRDRLDKNIIASKNIIKSNKGINLNGSMEDLMSPDRQQRDFHQLRQAGETSKLIRQQPSTPVGQNILLNSKVSETGSVEKSKGKKIKKVGRKNGSTLENSNSIMLHNEPQKIDDRNDGEISEGRKISQADTRQNIQQKHWKVYPDRNKSNPEKTGPLFIMQPQIMARQIQEQRKRKQKERQRELERQRQEQDRLERERQLQRERQRQRERQINEDRGRQKEQDFLLANNNYNTNGKNSDNQVIPELSEEYRGSNPSEYMNLHNDSLASKNSLSGNVSNSAFNKQPGSPQSRNYSVPQNYSAKNYENTSEVEEIRRNSEIRIHKQSPMEEGSGYRNGAAVATNTNKSIQQNIQNNRTPYVREIPNKTPPLSTTVRTTTQVNQPAVSQSSAQILRAKGIATEPATYVSSGAKIVPNNTRTVTSSSNREPAEYNPSRAGIIYHQSGNNEKSPPHFETNKQVYATKTYQSSNRLPIAQNKTQQNENKPAYSSSNNSLRGSAANARGTTNTGGITYTGGTTNTGGITYTGGTTYTGGITSTGGTTYTGGITSTGGTNKKPGITYTGGTSYGEGNYNDRKKEESSSNYAPYTTNLKSNVDGYNSGGNSRINQNNTYSPRTWNPDDYQKIVDQKGRTVYRAKSPTIVSASKNALAINPAEKVDRARTTTPPQYDSRRVFDSTENNRIEVRPSVVDSRRVVDYHDRDKMGDQSRRLIDNDRPRVTVHTPESYSQRIGNNYSERVLNTGYPSEGGIRRTQIEDHKSVESKDKRPSIQMRVDDIQRGKSIGYKPSNFNSNNNDASSSGSVYSNKVVGITNNVSDNQKKMSKISRDSYSNQSSGLTHHYFASPNAVPLYGEVKPYHSAIATRIDSADMYNNVEKEYDNLSLDANVVHYIIDTSLPNANFIAKNIPLTSFKDRLDQVPFHMIPDKMSKQELPSSLEDIGFIFTSTPLTSVTPGYHIVEVNESFAEVDISADRNLNSNGTGAKKNKSCMIKTARPENLTLIKKLLLAPLIEHFIFYPKSDSDIPKVLKLFPNNKFQKFGYNNRRDLENTLSLHLKNKGRLVRALIFVNQQNIRECAPVMNSSLNEGTFNMICNLKDRNIDQNSMHYEYPRVTFSNDFNFNSYGSVINFATHQNMHDYSHDQDQFTNIEARKAQNTPYQTYAGGNTYQNGASRQGNLMTVSNVSENQRLAEEAAETLKKGLWSEKVQYSQQNLNSSSQQQAGRDAQNKNSSLNNIPKRIIYIQDEHKKALLHEQIERRFANMYEIKFFTALENLQLPSNSGVEFVILHPDGDFLGGQITDRHAMYVMLGEASRLPSGVGKFHSKSELFEYL